MNKEWVSRELFTRLLRFTFDRNPAMNMNKDEHPERVMHEVGGETYQAGTGHTASREYDGQTPHGNAIGGRWVLRSPSGEYMDVDQYRHDLFSRNGFFTSY